MKQFSSNKLESDITDLIQSAERQCENSNIEFLNGYMAAMADVWHRTTGERLEIEDNTNVATTTTEVPF